MADTAPETSFAERARTLVHRGCVGALATHSRRVPGFPFASVAPYGVDERGNPVFLVSTLAMHTQNLLSDDRASLLVAESAAAERALAVSRVTLVGRVSSVSADVAAALGAPYLERHPAAHAWVELKDFGWYRLEVAELYYVAGFGAMGWVAAEDYAAAAVDPLADHAEGILEHMNADHSDAVLLYAQVLAGVEADTATMIGIDRLGFQVRACKDDQHRTVRLGFPSEVRSTDAARQALIGLLKTARERA